MGEGLLANNHVSFGRRDREITMIHSRGSGSRSTTSLCLMENVTVAGWHPVQKLHRNRRPSALAATAGSAFFKVAVASATTCGTMAGHLGVKKMQNQLMRLAYWRGLRADVALFCKWCMQCNVPWCNSLCRQVKVRTRYLEKLYCATHSVTSCREWRIQLCPVTCVPDSLHQLLVNCNQELF